MLRWPPGDVGCFDGGGCCDVTNLGGVKQSGLTLDDALAE
jgi:hypothetical protein